jgi:methionyl-tRNA formyltransferase
MGASIAPTSPNTKKATTNSNTNKPHMRIVFMGTPDFAVESLKTLVENNCNIVGVITAPDKPAGRGQKLQQSPVKEYALAHNLKVLQPLKLKDTEFIAELETLKADLQIVVAFRMLPEAVWRMPRLGTFNLHGSLLPQYRGAAPINWAVINGEKQTGVTTFFIQQEIDTGGIIYHEKIDIGPTDNAGTIHDKLMVIGASLVLKTVRAIEAGKIVAIPQEQLASEVELKPAPKIFKDDCKIDWTKDKNTIHNLIRGLSPYPTAWTELTNNQGIVYSLKIFDSEVVEANEMKPSAIKTDGKSYIYVGCANGSISLKTLQLSGKKRMSVDEFLRGNKIDEFKTVN